MRALLLTALALVLSTTASHAQQETIGQHYHAYTAALQNGDLATAEREAAAALQLSEAQDGDGGHTAVLALNLATTRLSAGHGADALAPAQQALTIAQANPDAGVDPLMVQLAVGRAELASGRASGAAHLEAFLNEAKTHGDLSPAVFQASADLGAWDFSHYAYPQAKAAWQIAVDSAGNADEAANLARAAAETGLEAAIVMTNKSGGVDMREVASAQIALTDAFAVYAPYVRSPIPPAGLTVVQRSYSQAYAWSLVLVSQVVSAGRRMPAWPSARAGLTASGDTVSASNGQLGCAMRFIAEPRPTYPNHQNNAVRLGGVVVYLETDESGQIVRREVAAAIGADFADAVRAVLPQWRMEKDPSSPANCSMAGPHYRGVIFQFG